MSLIWLDDRADLVDRLDRLVVSRWIASIFWLMSSVALAVSLASSLTSLATTAKPLPASPARAASIVALSASRFVWSAIEVITLITLPISALDSPSLATVVLVLSATFTATVATLAASVAFLAISLMLAPISSTPVATVCTFVLTCSAAAEATLACAEVSSALVLIWLLTLDSFSAVPLRPAEFSAMPPMLTPEVAQELARPSPIRPSASSPRTGTSRVRSPPAAALTPRGSGRLRGVLLGLRCLRSAARSRSVVSESAGSCSGARRAGQPASCGAAW